MSEGFSNPVSNALGTLIRKALQSFGFVSGSFGWQITRAGNAEFNNGTFRGTIVDGPLAGAHIEIGPKLPPNPPGAGDEIRIYNGTPVEVIHIDPNGITAGNDLTNFNTANYVRMNVFDSNVANPAIEIQPGSSFAGNWLGAVLNTFLSNAGLANEKQAVQINSPAVPGIGYGPASSLSLIGGAHDGSSNGFVVTQGDQHFWQNHDGSVQYGSLTATAFDINTPAVMEDIDWNTDGMGTAETWHNLGFTPALWGNRGAGFPVFSWRRLPAPSFSLQIVGQMQPNGGATADGTVLANIPAPFRPATAQLIPVRKGTGAYGIIQLGTNGDLVIFDCAGSTLVQILGNVIPLNK